MTRTEAKWAERVREWRASGQTAEAFAEGRQFEPSTLRYWASRLKLPTAPTQAPSLAPPKAAVTMARVVRRRVATAAPVGSAEASEVSIVIGAARITVGRGFDADLLRDVVTALGGAR